MRRIRSLRLLSLAPRAAVRLAGAAWRSVDPTLPHTALAAGRLMQASCLGLL